MKEYEYSFKVINTEAFINYCKEHKYIKTKEIKQNRKIYENKHNKHMIARITTDIQDNHYEIIFDCKNVQKEEGCLKISKESIPIKIEKENLEKIESMLKVLDFEESVDNLRIRTVYQKDDIKFEIDDYIYLDIKVVAIEGSKEKVDMIY